ncbi:MAG: PTS sugar transporter subunit IIC [Clostridiaceae bacterium]|nr:PTS sugar transporter subunit IIC [Clostridiaceae bacterium]
MNNNKQEIPSGKSSKEHLDEDKSLLKKTLLEEDVKSPRKDDTPILKENLIQDKRKKSTNSRFKDFLKKQDIEISFQRYAIDALGAMALGLFASLLIGTIVNTIASLIGYDTSLGATLQTIGQYASQATGSAMAVAIGYSLKAPPLVLFTLAGVGLAANEIAGAGGPLAVLIIALITTEMGKLVSKTTKIDIIVTPLVTLIVGVGLSLWWAPAIGAAATAVGSAVIWATEQQPFIMGILVSVIMGIALTLPISSAAIAAAFGLVGLAGGAAHAGCCAQMVGFAVMSYKENKVGGLLAQGLGTSMLQMPNIVKNPKIWIPPTLASAITGPLSTMVFKIEMNGPPISSGMGTSGLVGPIGVLTGWVNPSEVALSHGAVVLNATIIDYVGLLLISIVLPAILTYLFAIPLRKINWIKENDLKLNLG